MLSWRPSTGGRRIVCSALAVTALVFGACGGEAPPPGVASESGGDASVGFDPYFQSLMGEAVVRAHTVESGDEYDVVGTVRQDFTVVVDDVLFVAEFDQDGAVPVPALGPGSLEVFEVLGFTNEQRRTDALLASTPGDGFVAVLNFSPAHPEAPGRSTWNVAAVADDRSGELHFPGRQAHVQHFFDTARTAFVPDPYGSDVELLVGVAEEALATFMAGGEPRGPIGTHVARLDAEAAPDP